MPLAAEVGEHAQPPLHVSVAVKGHTSEQSNLEGLLMSSAEFAFGGHGAHTSEMAATAVENVPSLHSVHTPLPMAVLNLPVPHAIHVAPFSPVYPASQTHAVIEVLSRGAVECMGQHISSLTLYSVESQVNAQTSAKTSISRMTIKLQF